jgi:hypothetical protein
MNAEVRPGVCAPRHVTALRRELAEAERALREQAEREAIRLVRAEHDAWREARDACHAFDRIAPKARARLEAIRAGGQERFPSELALAEMALTDVVRADAAYTIVSFANRSDRLRYLRGGHEREAVIREVLTQGGVYTDACQGHHFQEIVR